MRFAFYTLVSMLAFIMAGCSGGGLINNPNSGEGAKEGGAKLSFAYKEFNFGKVNAGAIVKHSFRFVNVGKGELVIQDARASCGCTVPQFPHHAIAAGDSGVIDVEFNSENRSGEQNKVISVLSNANPGMVELTLKGFVVNQNDDGPIQP